MDETTDETLELLRVKNQLLCIFKYYLHHFYRVELNTLINILDALKNKYHYDGNAFTMFANIIDILKDSSLERDKKQPYSIFYRLNNIYNQFYIYNNKEVLKETLHYIQPIYFMEHKF